MEKKEKKEKDIFFYNSTGTVTDAASAQLRIGLGLRFGSWRL